MDNNVAQQVAEAIQALAMQLLLHWPMSLQLREMHWIYPPTQELDFFIMAAWPFPLSS